MKNANYTSSVGFYNRFRSENVLHTIFSGHFHTSSKRLYSLHQKSFSLGKDWWEGKERSVLSDANYLFFSFPLFILFFVPQMCTHTHTHIHIFTLCFSQTFKHTASSVIIFAFVTASCCGREEECVHKDQKCCQLSKEREQESVQMGGKKEKTAVEGWRRMEKTMQFVWCGIVVNVWLQVWKRADCPNNEYLYTG